ncbi:MAG: hypothetical protein OES46_08040 [Gammaproteobacteria bacterium]|jgi:hypothetical protein|nr:hypothetical protein [Gammaproteobacteria bacterium]
MRPVLLAVMLLVVSNPGVADSHVQTVQLQGGGELKIESVEFNRWMPHIYYDQATDSLPSLHPELVTLAAHRLGTVGSTLYSLICYKTARDSPEILVTGAAVRDQQAWRIDVISSRSSYGELLLRVVEVISRISPN